MENPKVRGEAPKTAGAVGSATTVARTDRDSDADSPEIEPVDEKRHSDDGVDDNPGLPNPELTSETEVFTPPDTGVADRDHQQRDLGAGDRQSPPTDRQVRVREPGPIPADETHADDESLPVGEQKDRLDDKEWLESLAIRSQLTNPAIFDEQALLWRRIQPGIDHLLRLYRPSPEDIAVAGLRQRVRERYSYCVAFLTGVKPPEQWRVCFSCAGTGESRSLKKHCDHCKGAGFEVVHEGDDAGKSKGGAQ